MASGSSLLCERQFLCPLCRDVFSSPVSTPCGHSFCRACISTYWEAGAACRCPRCGCCFAARPGLCENTFARDMANRLRRERPHPSMPRPPDAEEPHLLHLGEESQRSHRLPQPIRSLEERMCQKHSRALELFCRRDQMCMCILCAESDHRSHDFVPVMSEWSEKQAQLTKIEAEVQQMMQDRWKKVEEIRQCVDLSRSSTEKEIEHSVQVFNGLMRSVEAGQAQLSEVMQEQQRAMEKRAEVLIKEVEQELTLLQNRRSQLEKLSQTEDHLYFLQSFGALSSPPNCRDWSGAGVPTDVCVGAVRRALEQQGASLSQQIRKLAQMEMEKLHQYSVAVVLDPSTAHPWLEVSEDGASVREGEAEQDVPDEPQRFDTAPCVLAKEGYSWGRSYWEVQVQRKTAWDLGVATVSINRKGMVTLAPGSGYWSVCFRGSELQACSDPPTLLPLQDRPSRVGVFVDYEGEQVSFYDVEARTHIYSFTGCSFTEKLLPYFSPGINDDGTNAAPLVIISPVNHLGGGAVFEDWQVVEPVKL